MKFDIFDNSMIYSHTCYNSIIGWFGKKHFHLFWREFLKRFYNGLLYLCVSS